MWIAEDKRNSEKRMTLLWFERITKSRPIVSWCASEHHDIYICVCVCVYIYVCVFVCVYIYIYIYIYVCVCVCIHIYIHISTYVRTYIHKHTHTHTHTHTYIYTYIHTFHGTINVSQGQYDEGKFTNTQTHNFTVLNTTNTLQKSIIDNIYTCTDL